MLPLQPGPTAARSTLAVSGMSKQFLADSVVVVHFLFIAFVILGGLLVLRWPKLALLHIPAACWGALIELTGGICPLTPLENALRRAAGGAGYGESFIEHYLLPIIYPAGLTRGIQWALAAVVIVVNGALYGWLIYRRGRFRAATEPVTAPGREGASRHSG